MIIEAILAIAFGAAPPLYSTCPSNPNEFCPQEQLTPGVATAETEKLLCDPNFHTGSVRHVTEQMKKMVCLAYHVGEGCPGPDFEIDHLIPLELGGSNDPKNLWPQPIVQAREKDEVERHMHNLVCEGKMSLDAAQKGIAHDWWLMKTTLP